MDIEDYKMYFLILYIYSVETTFGLTLLLFEN